MTKIETLETLVANQPFIKSADMPRHMRQFAAMFKSLGLTDAEAVELLRRFAKRQGIGAHQDTLEAYVRNSPLA